MLKAYDVNDASKSISNQIYNTSRVIRKGADQLSGTADKRLYFHYIDSTINLLYKSEILSLYPYFVVVQPVSVGLGRPETPKIGFLMTWFINVSVDDCSK